MSVDGTFAIGVDNFNPNLSDFPIHEKVIMCTNSLTAENR